MDTRVATPLRLPPSTLFPVVITALLFSEDSQVSRHDALLKFKYWNTVEEPVDEANGEEPRKVEREFHSTFQTPIEGKITQWNVFVGSEIVDPNFVFANIMETCNHAVQYAGLCAICGAKLDEQDYTEFNNSDRAPIAMAHDSTGLTVSFDEAQRMDKLSSSQLLKSKKLILVVDLDQTVIHAAVDPTIGEWKSDPNNPNFSAVKDVKSFTLLEEGFVPGVNGAPPKPRQTEYYVKIRPGLEDFLTKMHELYEMHVYTMATRAYAVAIAKIIDPEGVYFGDRILSRDESGNIHQKSLQRLFPVSTAMVAIIDDRGDVWKWSPNLIKVVPYNFFVGIGDINSNFLPQQNAVILPPDSSEHASKEPPPGVTEESTSDDKATIVEETPEEEGKESPKESTPESKKATPENEEGDEKSEPKSPESIDTNSESALEYMKGADNDELLAVQSMERSQMIESQLLERPLAKQQQLIEKESQDTPDSNDADKPTQKTANNTPTPTSPEPRGLLHNGDKELEHLDTALSTVHKEYYTEYDQLVTQKGGIEKLRESDLPDLGVIMPRMKRKVFNNCVILFSGILPLGTDLDRADIVQWVRSFGAIVVANLIDTVTHVIARKNGTRKVRKAFENPNIKVVQLSWLFECIAQWKRVPEEAHLLEKPEGGDDALPLLMGEETTSPSQREDVMVDIETDSFVNSLNDSNIDWNEINMELDEFMNSSDDDDDDDSGENSKSDSSDSSNSEDSSEDDSDSEDDEDGESEKGQTGRKTVSAKRLPDEEAGDEEPRKRGLSPDESGNAKRAKVTEIDENEDDSDDDDEFAAELEKDLL